AADTDLQVRTGRPALLDGDADEAADTRGVERLERRDAEDAQLQEAGEEGALDVVAREAPAHLGQVVGAEREELRARGDLPGRQRRPRHLDHGADRDAYARRHVSNDVERLRAYDFQLLHGADE